MFFRRKPIPSTSIDLQIRVGFSNPDSSGWIDNSLVFTQEDLYHPIYIMKIGHISKSLGGVVRENPAIKIDENTVLTLTLMPK